jgi:hypothetical protein
MNLRCWSILAVLAVAVPPRLSGQQATASGAVEGSVVGESGGPVAEATIRVLRLDGSDSREATTDAAGVFRVAALPAGFYRITARRIGYREAQLPSLRVIPGQSARVRVVLTASPTQLSSVTVLVTPTSIDATTPELARRIMVATVTRLPVGRDASSLVDLVPGARRGFIWGAGSDAANNYQLDGVSVNHPGVGGEFLPLSIDWIEALEVRGLGAGAELGNFQGGIVNAVTKTGTNKLEGGLRVDYISPSLTASNILPDEEGAEQSMRREMSAQARGPLIMDRLFYFVAGQRLDRRLDVPDLTTTADNDFRNDRQEFDDTRALGKLTFRPGPRDRVDGLIGYSGDRTEHADLNGIDDPAASRRIRGNTTFYGFDWTRLGVSSSLDVRLAGFDSKETRHGLAGSGVPGVQAYGVGRQPASQNAPFNDRFRPRNAAANITWKRETELLGGRNETVIGGEYVRGSWLNTRSRNGGLTWRPYVDQATGTVDPARPASWIEAGSDWGGEIRLHADVEDASVFFQDYFNPIASLTIAPGVRFGRWSGWLTPPDSIGSRFLAATDRALDPRIGIVWDISGRNALVAKAHWGRFHQGMNAAFFDRAAGAAVYSNERFYFSGPPISTPTQIFTPAQRDAMTDTSEFGDHFAEFILNEEGRVENYKQPYVDQIVLGLEKTFGPKWKLEAAYTNRVNRNIPGLVDRNLENNYSRLANVRVRYRITFGAVPDQGGNDLILPEVWVANSNLRAVLIARSLGVVPGARRPVPGYSFADINTLTFDPDIVLTTLPDARRRMDQMSLVLRTEHTRWNGLASATATRLRGNVAALTSFTSTATSFTAGPGVRPNERINYEGYLPQYPAFEARTWIGANLIHGLRGGIFSTYSLGEYFAPVFQLSPRFRFQAADGTLLEDELFSGVLGQTMLLEERGSRKYQPRFNVDLRLERNFTLRGFEWALTADLLNALASDAIVARNLSINDQVLKDPTSVFGAPRRRVTPLSLQLGARVAF